MAASERPAATEVSPTASFTNPESNEMEMPGIDAVLLGQ